MHLGMFAKAILLVALLPGALGLGILFPVYFCGYKSDCNTNQTTCPSYSPIISGIQAHPIVPVYMIINPNNAPLPTSTLNASYPVCIPKLKAASPSSVVLGYVRTNYAKQPVEDVENNITAYASWPTSYRPTGIFFDEVTNDADSGHVSRYASYALYARNLGFTFIVFNPGTSADKGYFTASAADLVVTYEGPYSSFNPSKNLSITPSTPASKQAVLMYNGPKTSPTSLIHQLGPLGVGTVFVTDDTYYNSSTDNPWDTVPTIWAKEVADVASAPKSVFETVIGTWIGLLVRLL